MNLYQTALWAVFFVSSIFTIASQCFLDNLCYANALQSSEYLRFSFTSF